MVLGARGLSSLEKLVFGSISQGVLSEGCCPTLVVKKPITEVKRVLLPLKGPEDAAAAYAFLEKKPFGPSTQITVVTIPTSARDAAQKLVDDAASRISSISSLGYSASASIVTGIPGGAIVQFASEMQPDIILMGSHGGRGLHRLALGSVSEMVLHNFQGAVAIFPLDPSA
ncbi:MAG TPA: hypothetical protein EYN18_02155 [Nitrospirales bacterium]|nr:hypothetical protein [Nitrospirales bacterium]HIA14304.1 hypothetical protein [Nitrospirales bacterium]HIC04661.1 hypothetical protein [Nitrospirales bacterium]HIN33833.1 hypothetical protein [Nitrospirales bacterium]HIO21185.1 hypothetical protein [Nitrospirales bacterium]